MSIDRVAVNASPLITLYRANLHPLLPQMFPEILVPEAVWAEVVSRTHHDPAAQGLPTAVWARQTHATILPEVEAWNLGAGETALLSLAFSDKSTVVILDDYFLNCGHPDFGQRKAWEKWLLKHPRLRVTELVRCGAVAFVIH